MRGGEKTRRETVKPICASLSGLALLLGACACGSTRSGTEPSASSTRSATTTPVTVAATTAAKIPKPSVSPVPPNRPGIKDAYDGDDKATRETEEGDDGEVEKYALPGTAAQWQEAEGFVKAYYAAAVKEDGAAACKLLVPSLAEKLPKPEGGPGYPTGKTCPEVMTKLFVTRHKLIGAEAPGVQITSVRSAGTKTSFILLAFKGLRERRFMGVERFGNTMKLEAPQDSPYP